MIARRLNGRLSERLSVGWVIAGALCSIVGCQSGVESELNRGRSSPPSVAEPQELSQEEQTEQTEQTETQSAEHRAHPQPRRFALETSSRPSGPARSLSAWSPLRRELISEPHGLEALWGEIDRASREQGPLPFLPERALFCLTRQRAVHLALRGDLSPALSFPPPPRGAPHRALFILDLDAPRSTQASGESLVDVFGEAPTWLNQSPPPDEIKRAPMLLWALDELPASLTALPEGFGGRGLQLNGKPAREVRLGSPWLNDYAHWFYTPAARGDYTGYDGPCVAWNDPLQHHRVIVLIIASPAKPEPPRHKPRGRELLSQMLRTGAWYSASLWVTAGANAPAEPLLGASRALEAR